MGDVEACAAGVIMSMAWELDEVMGELLVRGVSEMDAVGVAAAVSALVA